MILKYSGVGPGYTHDDQEVRLSVSKRTNFDNQGRALSITERWNIDGFLQADTSTAIMTKIDELTRAYGFHGGDLEFFFSDGTTLTSHVLKSNDTLDGIRIIDLNFPFQHGAQLTTFEPYQIVAEADRMVATDPNTVIRFSETVEVLGQGQPTIVFLPTLVGPWQKQQTTQTSTTRARQSGSATGLFGYPPAPPALYPGDLIGRPSIRRRSPRMRNGKLSEYTVNWNYQYEANGTLAGIPNPPQ